MTATAARAVEGPGHGRLLVQLWRSAREQGPFFVDEATPVDARKKGPDEPRLSRLANPLQTSPLRRNGERAVPQALGSRAVSGGCAAKVGRSSTARVSRSPVRARGYLLHPLSPAQGARLCCRSQAHSPQGSPLVGRSPCFRGVLFAQTTETELKGPGRCAKKGGACAKRPALGLPSCAA
jgi:hypothetical protein